ASVNSMGSSRPTGAHASTFQDIAIMPAQSPDVNNGVASQPKRPTALPVNAAGIPAEIRALAQYVLWKFVWDPSKKKKWDKPPFSALSGNLASSTDRQTWATLQQALAMLQKCPDIWDGIGLCMDDRDPREDGLILIGIDLDHCRNPETGEI